MRILLQHRTSYQYPEPASLGAHTVRLRPATHAKAKIETYALKVEQPCGLRWQQDPAGNRVARLTFEGERVRSLDLLVEMAVDIRPVNPFDFFIDPRCEQAPFVYGEEFVRDLTPYLDTSDPAYATGQLFAAFEKDLPREGRTVDLIVALNRAVNGRLRYVIREEPGVWTPEETLQEARGSCRDSATLLVALLRSRGLAARFVSGYLIQLTDEGMIPDEPKGVTRDVVDLHAWAEVYLPGGGWIGLDATSGLLCGEGHIPLACASRSSAAAPLDGTTDVAANAVSFDMKVGRLGHEPRPTAPFPEETWTQLLAAGDRVDQALASRGVELTAGGEPTFSSRLHPLAPEWNTEALGPTKWEQGLVMAHELRTRLASGACILRRFGKHYPGESLPRWALDVVARRDGTPLVRNRAPVVSRRDAPLTDARRMIDAIAERLGVDPALSQPGYEDPWHYVREESLVPVDVDPHKANLKDAEDRRRLARILDRGIATDVGYALALEPSRKGPGWLAERWTFRRERMYLIPGDSPMGLRLPLTSISGRPPAELEEETYDGPPDPRRADTVKKAKQASVGGKTAEAGEQGKRDEASQADEARRPLHAGIRTALCVEPREGSLFVFLPPMPSAARFCELVRAIDDASAALDIPVVFEGYPPPKSWELWSFAVTPDPGVLEVNIPPTRTSREHVELMEKVFDAAAHAGLVAEKYQVDGRPAGSGGGNHITLGGPSPLQSPFARRHDLLASFVTFTQHHPSLSFLFTGLFVGPTSQAPRVDESRHESLYELEIALAKLRERDPRAPPWLGDALLRNLLVDVSGNTHRTEICVDKLFDPVSAHGRQGLIELRAFEMPPHVRLAVAQTALVRALVAAFAREPYAPNRGKLVRWGQTLHDRFLLPTWLWRDFEDVLDYLEGAGVPLPKEAYWALLELRCPIVGALQAEDVHLEIRNAIEPWNVLGEEVSASGTARYVDSSMERVEVRVDGLVPERHVVTVNGHALPLRPTGTAGEHVGGVRFRAWAPPHSLHPHIGIHHPLQFDILDTWGKRSLGACAYHVWHPEGRAYDEPPLTRFEASARRAQRFTLQSPMLYPARAVSAAPHPDAPYTLDLRRFPIDRPMPE
jgi:uncharacterized protein (DUF2126 family)/transglutaminase-like putative cysteine protease